MKKKGILYSFLFVFPVIIMVSCTDLKELPPTAGPMLILSPSQNYGAFPMTVSFVIEAVPSRGSIKSLIIDYGDGAKEDIKDKLKDNKVVLTRTYENLGVFYVKLYGMDDSGASETGTTLITNDAPKIDNFSAYKDPDFFEPTSNFVPGDTVYVRALCSDMNGLSYVLFIWGDGEYTQSLSCQASHRYARSNDYNITIIVYDSNRFAPYPLSSSQTIEVSVFEGAGSSENIDPFVDFAYDYVKNGIVFGNSVVGVATLEVGVFIGVSDLDSDLQRVFIDWGDGEAAPIELVQAVEKSGRRYIFRLSHQYKKEGQFFMKVIAYDTAGKIGTAAFGPISVFVQSPALYVEAMDQSGNNVDGKTFSSPLTLKIRSVPFDVAGNYNIYVAFSHVQSVSAKKEFYIQRISGGSGLGLYELSYTLSSKGNYGLTIFVIPQGVINDFSCIYCSGDSGKLNGSLSCSQEENFNSTSSCEVRLENLKNAQIKSEKVFSFSIQ